MAEDDPSQPSSDYKANEHYWKVASDILGGSETMRATTYATRVGGPSIQVLNQTQQEFANNRGIEALSPYLPKLPNEEWQDYDRRRKNAFLTNIYSDISNNLSSKPFSKTCELAEDTPDDVKLLTENIDGLGNNLHVYASEMFKVAIDKGIVWTLCDHTKIASDATLEDERRIGARPYWIMFEPEKILAVYSKFLNGKEVIFQARIDESCTEVNGYEETHYKRVRVITREPVLDAAGVITDFLPAVWALYQEDRRKDPTTSKEVVTWDIIDFGEYSIGIIPLVPLVLGKRKGLSWQIDVPMRDLLDMQVKLFQMESNLDYIKEMTAFPMLTGNGVTQGSDSTGSKIKVPVGPRAVLFAPSNADGQVGSWAFIEPSGSSLSFLEENIEKYKVEMRDLGMQPLTAANLTVVTTANLAMKANSKAQAWALACKDALEQMFVITMMWMKKQIQPEVIVHTDFAVNMEGDGDLNAIASAQKDAVIPKKRRYLELKRRGVLSDDADWEEDQEQMADEQSNDLLTPEVHIDPVTGKPIIVEPAEGDLNPPPEPLPPGEKQRAGRFN